MVKGTCKVGGLVSVKVDGDYSSLYATGDFDDQVYLDVVNSPCDATGTYAFPVTSFMLKRLSLNATNSRVATPYRFTVSIVDPLDPAVTAVSPKSLPTFEVNPSTNITLNPLNLSSNPTPAFTGTCTITGRPLIFTVTIPPATNPQEINTTETCPSTGNWSWTPSIAIPIGLFTIKAEAIDPLGYPYSAEEIKSGTRSLSYASINIPNAIVAPVAYPYLTNDNTPLVYGNCEPGSILDFVISPSNQTLTINCPSLALDYGSYSFSTSTIVDGSYFVTVNASGGVAGPITVISPVGIIDTAVLPRTITSTPILNKDNTPTFTGTCEAGSTLVFTKNTGAVSMGPNIVCPGLAGQANPAFGTYSFDSLAIGDGNYIATVTSTDVAGNTGTATFAGNIDTSTNASLNLQFTSDVDPTSISNISNLSNNNKPIFTGTCEPNANLIFAVQSPALPAIALNSETINYTCPAATGGTNPNGSAKVAGNYSVNPLTALADGTYSVSLTVTDLATNTFTIGKNGTVDTINSPNATLGSLNTLIVPINTVLNPLISGTCEPYASLVFTVTTPAPSPTNRITNLTCTSGGSSSGTFSFTPNSTGFLDGSTYTVTYQTTDQAGNIISLSGSNTIDQNTTVDVIVDNIPNLSTTNSLTKALSTDLPSFSGTCELGATIALKVYDLSSLSNLIRANPTIRSQGTTNCVAGGSGGLGRGVYSTTLPTPLLNQLYIVEAVATDINGNVSNSTTSPNSVYGFRVDTIAPGVAYSVVNLTNNNKLPISGTCEAGSIVTITINGSGSGSMGSTGYGSATNPPAAPSQATVESGMVTCIGTYPGIGNFTFTPTIAIPDGNYSVSIYATDFATNTTSASPVIRTNGNVDTVNYISLNINPSNSINYNVITFSGICEPGGTLPTNGLGGGSGGGVVSPANINLAIVPTNQIANLTCSSAGTWSFTPPSTGIYALINENYSVSVTATDIAGNIALASGAASTKFISASSPTLTNDNTPAITGACFAGSTLSFVATPNLPIGTGAAAQVVTQGSTTTPQSFSIICPEVDNLALVGTSGYNNGATNGANSTYLTSVPLSMPDGNYTVEVTSFTSLVPSGTISASVVTVGQIDSISSVTIDTPAIVATSTPTIFGTCEAGSVLNFVINPGSNIIVPTIGNPNPSELVSKTCSGTYGQPTPGNYSFNTTVSMPNGFYTVQATSSDQLNNTKVFTITNVILSTVLSTVAVPATGLGNKPSASGTCEANSSVIVKIFIGGPSSNIINEIINLICSPTGAYSFTPNNIIPDGQYTIKTFVSSIISANSGVAFGTGTIDTQTVISLSGSIANPTFNTSPNINGSCESGATIAVTISQNSPGITQVVNTICNFGSYSVTPSIPLVAGIFSLSITAKDIYYSSIRPTQNIATTLGSGTILANQNPIANSDAYIVNEDSSPNSPATLANQFDVLTNDTDADGHSQIFIVPGSILLPANLPSHGNITIVGTGDSSKIYYTPIANYNGPDSFTYTISDGQLGSINSTATVNITVTPVNDLPVGVNDNYTVDEDSQAINPTNIFDILINDNDIDNNTLTITNLTQPANGTVTIVNNKAVYVPNTNYNNTPTTKDTFTYTANDGIGNSNVVIVSVIVNPVNDLPIANPDSKTVAENSSGVTNEISVLSNDTDIDLITNLGTQTLSIFSFDTVSAHGTISKVTNPGYPDKLIYTPNLGYTGTDLFTYIITDGVGSSNSTTVSIIVTNTNDSPVANPDNYTVVEDSIGTNLSNQFDILENDTDADGHVQIFILNPTGGFTQPAHGVINIFGSGDTAKLIYTPIANYNGPDSFTYTISDGQLGSINSTATVNITVTPVNDLPVGVNDNYTVDEDSINNLFDVIANDSDIDLPPQTLTITNLSAISASKGVLSISNNKIVYTPALNYNNTPSNPLTFTYTANDGIGNSNTVTVSVVVTPILDPTFVTLVLPAINVNPQPTFTGTCEPGASVILNITIGANNTNLQTLPSVICTPPAIGQSGYPNIGSFSVSPTINIPAGKYCGKVIATNFDNASAIDTKCSEISVTVLAPTNTTDTKPNITGSCTPSILNGYQVPVVVTISVGNNTNYETLTTTCSISGSYSVTPTIGIPVGFYNVTAKATDIIGNVATATSGGTIISPPVSSSSLIQSSSSLLPSSSLSSIVQSSSFASSSIISSSTVLTTGIIVITQSSIVPEIFDNISDPYKCGKDITGEVSSNYGVKSVVVKLFTRRGDGSYESEPKYIFRPILDDQGKYQIQIEYTNEDIFVKGDYRVEYTAVSNNNSSIIKSYLATITNYCANPIPPIILESIEIKQDGTTIRTGGNIDQLAYFTLSSLIILISYGWWLLIRKKIKVEEVFGKTN